MDAKDVENGKDHAEDEDYDSGADEDFNPDAPVADEEAPSSSDEEEPSNGKPQKRKDVDFDNSGDEATITRAKKKRRKGNKEDVEDDEGGEGGLVKTRAQRKAEGVEKKPLAQTGAASADVNALWAQMSGPSNTPQDQSAQPPSQTDHSKPSELDGTEQASQSVANSAAGEETIIIKRTYEFAGQKMEEEKTVPASSQEAKLYLGEQARKQEAAATASKPSANIAGLRRPKKRVSAFDTAASIPSPAASKGTKLNTIEKSKLDWAAHVDQEGISEELDDGRRAKNNYLGRMDFLGRSDAKREDGR